MAQHTHARMQFLAVDFFCGAGGVTRGLIDAGGYVIAGIDHDARCMATYVSNNHNRTGDGKAPHFLHYDVFPATADYPRGQQGELRDELGGLLKMWRARYPTLPVFFTVCAPCQPFTALAKNVKTLARNAAHIQDMKLLQHALTFIEDFQPDIVFSENVPRITNSVYGGVWEAFCQGLVLGGYRTASRIVNASHFGVPQARKRSVLLAVLHPWWEARGPLTLTVPTLDHTAPRRTVREVLQHFPPLKAGETHPTIPNHATRALQDINLRRIARAEPGASNAYMQQDSTEGLGCQRYQHVLRSGPKIGFDDVYTRMHPDRPAPTLTTKCLSISNGRFGHYDVAQLRGISVREAATLQSFPEDYVFYPTDQLDVGGRMVGNAVPPRLACFFAKYLLHILRQERRTRRLRDHE